MVSRVERGISRYFSVACQQQRIGGADLNGLSHAVVAMRKTPAVISAPPFPVEILTYFSRKAHVVRDDAAIRLRPFLPGSHIFLHPIHVLLFAAQ